MKGHGSFARANAMMAAIAAVMTRFQHDFAGQQAALSAIGPYRSRGKGGKRPHRSTGIAAARRGALKARNVRRNRSAHRG